MGKQAVELILNITKEWTVDTCDNRNQSSTLWTHLEFWEMQTHLLWLEGVVCSSRFYTGGKNDETFEG